MNFSRRKFVAGASLAGLSAGLPMRGFAQDVARSKTLRVMPQADLKILDPIWTSAAITLEHGYLIYDKLFERDRKGVPHPQMAEHHEISPDGLVHEIKLRDGLRFHDNTNVTSADVVQSLKRWGKRDALGVKMMRAVEAMEAAGATTIRIRLKEPFTNMEMALSNIRGNPAFIMPAKVAETEPSQQVTSTVGSGPFLFRRDLWKPGSRVVYDKAPTYRPRSEPGDGYAGGKVAWFDRVEFTYIPDYNTAMNAIMAGETDIWELLPNDYVPLLSRGGDVTAVRGMPAYGIFRPNHLFPPFDNPKARQALLHIIDQKDLLTAVTGDPNYFETCPSFFACGGPYASNDGVKGLLKVDLDRAKQLLKEAGYDGRPVVVFDTTDIAALHTASLYLAQQLRLAGVNVNLQAMDWSTTISRYPLRKPPQEGGWNVFTTYTSALDTVSPFVHSWIGGGTSAEPGWPSDARIEDLTQSWMKAGSEPERVAIAKEIQARADETVPYVPWGQFYTARARRNSIQGFYGEAPVPVYWGVSREG